MTPRNAPLLLLLTTALATGLGTACADDDGSPASDADAGDAGVASDDVETSDISDAEEEAGGVPLSGPPPEDYNLHPEPPSILRDVAMVDDENRWTAPFIPGLRTTQDGRVGLRVQGGPSTFSFYLFVPEQLDGPIMDAEPGLALLSDPTPVVVEWPPATVPNLFRIGHHAICDPTFEFAEEGEKTNPYPCGPDLANDCYDFTIISSISRSLSARMWGTPATVEVENPKTPDASIMRVELGEAVPGATLESSFEWAEVAVTIDGRLLSGRWGGAERPWTHPETGEVFRRQYDLGYSFLPEEFEPCDVTGWTDFHPISHAPFDPALRGRYGVAAYPFRDTEGNPIPDGEDMGGSYPWMDREGANVFMTAVPGTLHEQPREDFPRRCVVEGCEDFENGQDFDRGVLVAGLWTHGRLVHLDTRFNNMDWSIGLRPDAHMWVDLYQTPEGDPVPVRFGAGRGHVGTPPPGHPGNENILDSLQNMPNFWPAARPVTPRDVVWVMSTGVATDEVVFDDFMDPRAFIISNMQPSITQLRNERGHTTGIPIHWNGQRRERTGLFPPISNLQPYELIQGAYNDVHIQNAATSLDFPVPAFGLVEAETGRTEPVALGGVVGRGFWLDGVNRIRYAIPAQDAPISDAWYIGIFVDARASDGASRALLTFPDGTSIRMIDDGALQYVRNERVFHEVALPATDADWRHLGWHVRDDQTEITLLVDGLAFDRFHAERAFFRIEEGELVVGRANDRASGEEDRGVRGWVDEFKVLAHGVDPEVACNHAGGTLVRVVDNPVWSARADAYPDWAHDEVAESAGQQAGGTYACFHDYSEDYGAHLGNIPQGTVSLRAAIHFPEGPLMAGAPRPDSSTNAFCLSCHHEGGQGGLGLGALAYLPDVSHEDDRRRQPLEPLRRVFGNIPPGWLPPGAGPGSPSEALRAPPEGLLIDPWVLPAAE